MNHNKRNHHNFAPVVRHDRRGREYCYRDYYSHRKHHNYWDFRLFGYWPSSRFTVVYGSPGFGLSFRYVYPRHHRKYVFVSVGGWWPSHYRYARYYNYGYHPYRWYGYYPEAYGINEGGVNSNNTTSNYYTYNYYYGEDGQASDTIASSSQLNQAQQQLQATDAEPAPETRADQLFNDAVKAFEDGSYDRAANLFADAMRIAGDDVVLPFAYSQALFADGQYVSSAQALRAALENLPPDKQDMFYPRGLYAEEETLTQQIDTLSKKVDTRSFDTDLQLLLGYHMVGTGQLEDAVVHLQRAAGASENKPSVDKLMTLIEKVQSLEK